MNECFLNMVTGSGNPWGVKVSSPAGGSSIIYLSLPSMCIKLQLCTRAPLAFAGDAKLNHI